MEKNKKNKITTIENPINLEIHTIKKSIFNQMLIIEVDDETLNSDIKKKVIGFSITIEKKFFDEFEESSEILWLITSDGKRIKYFKNKKWTTLPEYIWILELPQIFLK